jgi:hypothetical protein
LRSEKASREKFMKQAVKIKKIGKGEKDEKNVEKFGSIDVGSCSGIDVECRV